MSYYKSYQELLRPTNLVAKGITVKVEVSRVLKYPMIFVYSQDRRYQNQYHMTIDASEFFDPILKDRDVAYLIADVRLESNGTYGFIFGKEVSESW